MVRADRAISVHPGPGGGRVHSGVSGARVSGGGGAAHVSPGAAHGAFVPAGGAAAAAIAPRPSRAVAGNVPDAASLLGHGDVRVRLPVVPDGGTAGRDLARVSRRG